MKLTCPSGFDLGDFFGRRKHLVELKETEDNIKIQHK